ncbi:hypothetical protein OK344_00735 [Kaistella sp. BT6-1-3]|uniref:Uncharacterized protein n=1 Tax=Kaistella yananensis TaxID=2989820 RepID=A0ABT3JIY7_9FLAO|nr:hypothetical protein [Kaistella yananensis]MCW4450730.1 hypothetical protein [Kaistella yananensis]
MMKKTFTISIISLAIHFLQGQSGNVGINTTTPAATLDVNGFAADTAKLDGIIAPRITGNQLRAKNYTRAQTGSIVYATLPDTSPAGQTINVTSAGYYYFDGTIWQKLSSTANYVEPWYNQNTGQPATANNQNIYQRGRVSVNGNATNGILSVYDAVGSANGMMIYGSYRNIVNGVNPWFGFAENLGGGSFSSISNGGDMGLIFSVDNSPNMFTSNSFNIIPHSGAGGATYYGFKITDQGLFGFNVKNPSETLDIGGALRIRNLPVSGATNSIYTTPGGASSLPATTAVVPQPTQTFTATKTVVVDDNGVLGSFRGLPGSYNNIASKNGMLLSTDYTILATGNISLPPAANTPGKIYHIVYDGTPMSIYSPIFLNGASITNYPLNGAAGNSGITVQSNGTNWYIISKY